MPQKGKTKEKWYEDPIKKTFGLITGFVAIASLGYGVAIFQKNLEYRLEKFEMQQSFNERLQNQILECEKEKQLRDNKRVEEVETAIIELQKKINEK